MLDKSEQQFGSLSLSSSHLQLDALTLNNLGQLKVILQHELKSFKLEDLKYAEISADSQLGYFNDLCVGMLADLVLPIAT